MRAVEVTFPVPDERPALLWGLFYTCAGGKRSSSPPQSAIACRTAAFHSDRPPLRRLASKSIGICWCHNSRDMGASPPAEKLAGKFDRSALVIRSDNESSSTRSARWSRCAPPS